MPLSVAAGKHKAETNHASLRAEAAPTEVKDAAANNLTHRCLAQSEFMVEFTPCKRSWCAAAANGGLEPMQMT